MLTDQAAPVRAPATDDEARRAMASLRLAHAMEMLARMDEWRFLPPARRDAAELGWLIASARVALISAQARLG